MLQYAVHAILLTSGEVTKAWVAGLASFLAVKFLLKDVTIVFFSPFFTSFLKKVITQRMLHWCISFNLCHSKEFSIWSSDFTFYLEPHHSNQSTTLKVQSPDSDPPWLQSSLQSTTWEGLNTKLTNDFSVLSVSLEERPWGHYNQKLLLFFSLGSINVLNKISWLSTNIHERS